jgi:hypothetical protein
MIKYPKLEIDQVIEMIRKEKNFTLETDEQRMKMDQCMNVMFNGIGIDMPSAEQKENMMQIIQGVVESTVEDLCDKFEKIKEDSL